MNAELMDGLIDTEHAAVILQRLLQHHSVSHNCC